MAPNLPTSLRVGPHEFTVQEDRKAMAKQYKKYTGNSFQADCPLGLSNSRTCKVYINPKQHISQKRDTLLHEVLHCVWRESSWNTEMPTEDQEEYVVERMTAALLGVLRDNPEVIEYLLYKENTNEQATSDTSTTR